MASWSEATTQTSQAAYRKSRSSRSEVVKLLCQKGQSMYIGQLDLSKAFSPLCHSRVGQVLKQQGVPDKLITLLQQTFVRWTKGTPQGCALSILLFQLTLAPVVADLEARICHDRASAKIMVLRGRCGHSG
eukprot:3043736-Amphidinium_carterae.1